jgi:DHA1 family tetracycline resistance protein-like MFS transporter
METLRKRQTNILFLILFTDMIGFGMSIPLFGILFGSAQNMFYLGNVLGVENIVLYFGIFTALFGLGQFVANSILGALSDSIGRKPVLSFAIFGTLISRLTFIYALLNMNIFLLFISRFIDGATGGIIALANASITDTTSPEERGKYIGKIMAGFSLGGFVIGPAIFILFSGFSEFWSVVGPFVVGAILSLVAFVLCIMFFPETLAKEKIQHIPSFPALWEKFLHSLDNIKTVLKEKSSRPFFLAAGVFYFGFSSYTTFFSQYLSSHYGLNSKLTGMFFLIVGVTMVVMQGFLAYKIVKKFGMNSIILYTTTLLAASVFIFAFNNFYTVLFLNAFAFAALVSISMVTMQTEVSKIKSEHKGALMGAYSSIQVLASAISPILAGFLSKISVTLPFIFSGVLIIISGILLKKIDKI